MDTFKTILTGLGNIGRTLLELLVADSDRFALRYGFQLRIIGVADSTGVAFDPDGLDLPAIIDCKRRRLGVRVLPTFRPDLDPISLARTVDYDLLLYQSLVERPSVRLEDEQMLREYTSTLCGA